jgi:hypothetical protein
VTESGLHPVATVGGFVGVNRPVAGSIVNIETVLSSLFAVYTNLPEGSIVIPCGRKPVGTVAGVVGVNAPDAESMVNIAMVARSAAFDMRFAA